MEDKNNSALVLNFSEIKRRSVIGVATLTSRTLILQVIALISTFILTVLLDPAVFGIFFVVTAVVNFLNYFSDIGLAAALIQKKTEPTQEDLATTFTIQQLLVGVMVVLALFLATFISKFYTLGSGGLFLYRSLVVAFMLSSLKTIPSVLLERKLDFKKLVVPQIVETLVFYLVVIFLALRGMGVVSFAWAALARGVTGTSLLYLIAPWRPYISLNRESAKQLLSYGLPYQANSFLALIKDDLLTIFLGKILPFTQLGYIGWAKKWAEVALRLIMDNIIKVTFPTYSRLQHEPQMLAKALNKSLLFLSLLTFPIAVGMMFLIHPFIEVVPKYIKWEPAIPSFYLFTVSAILATLSSPLVSVLNAMGKVKYTLQLMLFWTILTWTLVPLLVSRMGFHGVATAALLIGLTSFAPLFIIKKFVTFSFLPQIAKPAIATIVMVIVVGLTMAVSPSPMVKLILSILNGSVTYAGLIYLLLGKELVPYFALLRQKT